MVKQPAQYTNPLVENAIFEAEAITSAELACVVMPASDGYSGFIFLFGFVVSSGLVLILSLLGILNDIGCVVLIQASIIALMEFVPWLRYLGVRMVPVEVRKRTVEHRAYEEYLKALCHMPKGSPAFLLYVSRIERCARIITSRDIQEKIPDTVWNGLLEHFASQASEKGLTPACAGIIAQASLLLKEHFPEKE